MVAIGTRTTAVVIVLILEEKTLVAALVPRRPERGRGQLALRLRRDPRLREPTGCLACWPPSGGPIRECRALRRSIIVETVWALVRHGAAGTPCIIRAPARRTARQVAGARSGGRRWEHGGLLPAARAASRPRLAALAAAPAFAAGPSPRGAAALLGAETEGAQLLLVVLVFSAPPSDERAAPSASSTTPTSLTCFTSPGVRRGG